MPTVLVIDDDPLVAASVRSAVRGWTVLEAYDGASGIALARMRRSILDLIVLDVRMPQHDGILVCVQLRNEFPDLPILPITGAAEAVSTLTGLGTVAPLLKPVSLTRLAEALHAALGTQPPPLAAEPLLPYVLRQAAASEHAATLHDHAIPSVALLASSELLRSGLRAQVAAAGMLVRVEATNASILRTALPQLQVAALIADDHVQVDAIAIAHDFQLPLIIVALTITAGYRAIDHACGVIIDPVAPDILANALLHVVNGQSYHDPLLDQPIAPGILTKTEQKVALRLLQGLRVDAIAEELAVQVDTVYQHRSHIYAKLEMTDLEAIRAYVDAQHLLRVRAAVG
jgi:DNA-binding NarL/FixJ family response regulator